MTQSSSFNPHPNLQTIIDQIAPLQEKLKHHTLYTQLNSLVAIQSFMSHHIYCVWDFMNLLKTLQSQLTCITVPWQPSPNPRIARLINEIVLEEESDEIEGEATSHFSYYLEAVKQLSHTQSDFYMFMSDLKRSLDYQTLIQQEYIPKSVQQFLYFSYSSIQTSTLHTAAAFTFGREALVPDLFTPIINHSSFSNNPILQSFQIYLSRHIELDGDHHSQLAYKMIEELCQSDADWELVQNHALATVNARLKLWNAISTSLMTSN